MTSVEKSPSGEKRAAFEIPSGLAEPAAVDVRMRRPVATTVGAGLVLLRVLAGVVWLMALAFQWPDVIDAVVDEEELALTADELGEASDAALIMVIVFGGLLLLIDLVLAVLIYLGLNWPRIVVMVLSTLSISVSFAAWWAGDQEITLQTTLLTLSLDILVMLALSSRAARAYARRPRRRKRR